MIKTKEGVTEIEGSAEEIMADFAVITKSVKKVLVKHASHSIKEAEDRIYEAVTMGLMPEDKVKKLIAKNKDIDEALEFLKKLSEKLNDDDVPKLFQ